MGGGVLAQLIQELVVCCQQGEVTDVAAAAAAATAGAANGFPASSISGRNAGMAALATGGVGETARMWGGAEEARAAAGCLHALCSFTPDATPLKKFLPGIFGGLFRAIRGVEVRSSGAASSDDGGALLFGSVASGSQPLLLGEGRGGVADRGRRGGASKSALAEACLGTLAKILLICADGGAGADPSSAASSPSIVAVEDRGGGGGGSGDDCMGGASGTVDKADINARSGNPMLALQRLAVASNASSRSAAAQDGTAAAPTAASIGTTTASSEGRRRVDGGSPSAPLPNVAPQAAFGAPGSAVDDPEWAERTSHRLRVLLPPLLAFCRLHPGWRVRRAAANLASDLLRAGCGGGGGGRGHGNGGGAGGGGVGAGGWRRGEGEERLLGPLTPLLMEALVGLLLDGMPQVGARCRAS